MVFLIPVDDYSKSGMDESNLHIERRGTYPIASMYGIFTYFSYMWLRFMTHGGKFAIHGSHGYILVKDLLDQ